MKKTLFHFLKVSAVIVGLPLSVGILTLFGCGGVGGSGGGGDRVSDDPNVTGKIYTRLERDVIGLGNFVQVRIELSAINEGGVILKVRYPTSLLFSKHSAVIFPGEREQREITPFIEDTAGSVRYLVFFLFPDTENGNDIRMTLNLKGIEPDEEAHVEFGLTNNDPNIIDSVEFKEGDPLFAAVDEQRLTVQGDANAVPTATAAVTGSPVGTTTPGGSTPVPTATTAAKATTAPTATVAATKTAAATATVKK